MAHKGNGPAQKGYRAKWPKGRANAALRAQAASGINSGHSASPSTLSPGCFRPCLR